MKKTANRWNAEGYTATYREAVGVAETMIKPFILSKIDLKSGSTVLECGVGSGKWSAAFALLGFDVYAIDKSMGMLMQAQANSNFYNAVKGYVSIIVPYKSEEEDEICYTKERLRAELKDVGFSIVSTYEITFLSGDQVTTRRLIGVNACKK
jgi:SAM-dependent methyltransferase